MTGAVNAPISNAFQSDRDDGARWYAVATHPCHEQSVTGHLDAKSIESFLPVIEVESRWKDRRVRLARPAFPRYVFTRISLGSRRAVLSVPGVARLLSFNGSPAPIDDTEIDGLRQCKMSGLVVEPHPFLAIGERVRVHSGSLKGLEGIIARPGNGCRLVLSIAGIHQSVAIEIDSDLLEPAVGEA